MTDIVEQNKRLRALFRASYEETLAQEQVRLRGDVRRVFRTYGRNGNDYGWNSCNAEEERLLREAGCELILDPNKDMRGKKWLAGSGRRRNT